MTDTPGTARGGRDPDRAEHADQQPTATVATGTAIDQNVDVIDVTLPARSSYVTVLRSTTAALASRVEFTLDAIEDLRIGVDEACALLLAQADTGSLLHTRFRLSPSALDVTVSAPCTAPQTPSRDSFAWTVLTALVESVDTQVDDGHLSVRLTKRVDEQ